MKIMVSQKKEEDKEEEKFFFYNWQYSNFTALHKLAFITFLIASLLHMILSCILTRHCRGPAKNTVESDSFKWKMRMLLANISSILLACYFFYRHNKYCETNGKFIFSSVKRKLLFKKNFFLILYKLFQFILCSLSPSIWSFLLIWDFIWPLLGILLKENSSFL